MSAIENVIGISMVLACNRAHRIESDFYFNYWQLWSKGFFDLAMTLKMSRSDNKIGTQEGSSATAASTLIQKFNWSSIGSADSQSRGDSSQTPSHGFNQAAAVSEFQSSPGTLSWFFQRSVAMSEREINAMAPLSS